MDQPKPARHFIRDAIFLDIPYIVDSVCRHADYRLNRLHRYIPNSGAVPQARTYLTLPPFLCFLVILLFSAYGATLSALCGVFGATNIEVIRRGAGHVCIAVAYCQFSALIILFALRVHKRFIKADIHDVWRAIVVCLVLLLVVIAWSSPWYFLGHALLSQPLYLFGHLVQDPISFDTCRPNTQRGPAWIQLCAFLASAVLAALATKRQPSVRLRIFWQVLILAAMIGGLWYLPGMAVRSEAAQVPYHHLYAVVALGFAFTALIASCLVYVPFFSMTAGERMPFRNALHQHELFAGSRKDPSLSPRRIVGGGVIGVLHKPLQFLLLPSFAIILVPTGFLWHACLLGALASLLLIIASNLTSRWDQMSQYLRRYFLLGTPLVVSAGVIVMAALRLVDVQYVATVLNVAPFGVLFVWMVMAYALGWWFEYQVNSVLAAQLLKIFGANGRTDYAVIAYTPAACAAGPWSQEVKRTERYLMAHATGQFVVTGWLREKQGGKVVTAFNTFSFVELFSNLLEHQVPDAVHELERRIQLYFALVNSVLLIGGGLLFWYHGRDDRLNTVMPVVTARPASGANNLDLSTLLQAQSDHAPPAIVVAASGGGTRAALYTATVMQGLHALHADRDVVLLSGVSGGGVAAAYFFSHRAALLSDEQQRCDALDQLPQDPWQCYRDRMAMPFIRDVLQGAGEWRIQSEQPLGMLLAESFERRLFADGGKVLGDEAAVGLILNTTISGHPLADEPALLGGFVRAANSLPDRCADEQEPVAGLAGGRLAFTNLRQIDAFQKTNDQMRDIRLPFVVVQDERIELARAAALNANFPPVFPNARVDLLGNPSHDSSCAKHSYYVTDGGATENLGLLSALLALKSSLDSMAMSELQSERTDAKHKRPRLRNIEIVLAEASAIEYDYHQDRGVGAATGQSKERLAGRLTLELFEQVERAAQAIDPNVQVRVHDLSLPRVFRSRGGFGTHWMFPEFVRVTDPLSMPPPLEWQQVVAQYTGMQRFWVTLNRKQVLELWQDLYDDQENLCDRQWSLRSDPDEDLRTVSNWICGRVSASGIPAQPDGQLEAWRQFRELLKQSKN